MEAQLRSACTKLRGDYLRVKEQRNVLKRAVLDEQKRTADLTALLVRRDEDRQEVLSEIDRLNFDNQRLKVRIAQMMRELDVREQRQEEAQRTASGGSGGGGGLFSSLASFATGDADEVKQLRGDMAVVVEELRVKIEESEQTHMRCFDLERRCKVAGAELTALRAALRDSQAEHAAALGAKAECISTLADQNDALARRGAARSVDLARAERSAKERTVEIQAANATLVGECTSLRARLRRCTPLDERRDAALCAWDLSAVDVAARSGRCRSRSRLAACALQLARAVATFTRARDRSALLELHLPAPAVDGARAAEKSSGIVDAEHARRRADTERLRSALATTEITAASLASAVAQWSGGRAGPPTSTLRSALDGLCALSCALEALTSSEHIGGSVDGVADERAGAIVAERCAESAAALRRLLEPRVASISLAVLERDCEAMRSAARAYLALVAARAGRARHRFDARTPSAPALGSGAPADAAEGASLRIALRRQRRTAIALTETARDALDALGECFKTAVTLHCMRILITSINKTRSPSHIVFISPVFSVAADAAGDAMLSALCDAHDERCTNAGPARVYFDDADGGAPSSVRSSVGVLRHASVAYMSWCASTPPVDGAAEVEAEADSEVHASSAGGALTAGRTLGVKSSAVDVDISSVTPPGSPPCSPSRTSQRDAPRSSTSVAVATAAEPEAEIGALCAQIALQESTLQRQALALERSEAACVAMRAACDERVRLLSRSITAARHRSQ